MNEKTIKNKMIYTTSFLTLYEDDVLLDNGVQSRRVYIKHPGAVAVLPITKNNEIIFVKQYRYPIKQITIEIPAGKKDNNETGISCVKRELEEETGYTSNNIKHVVNIHNCLGYSNELIELFIAYDVTKLHNKIPTDFDEQIEVITFKLDEALKLVYEGIITDAKTILLLQHLKINTSIGKEEN